MLKKLRRRFVRIAFVSLAVLVMVQTISMNVANMYQKDGEVRDILFLIAESGGEFPKDSIKNSRSLSDYIFNPLGKVNITVETPYSTRYFVVKLNGNRVTDIDTTNITQVNDEQAFDFATRVFKAQKTGFGVMDNFRYYFAKSAQTDEGIMVFLDMTRDMDSSLRVAVFSTLIAISTILLLIWPIKFAAKKATEPIEKSIKKQQQFITDAGHELKTPLSIIKADVSVLQMMSDPESEEWLTSIDNQADRLSELVKNMVTLSKLEETNKKQEAKAFSLNDVCTDTVLDFSTIAKSNDQEIITDIPQGVTLVANEAEIRQLLSILFDNAIKYTPQKGLIKLSVKRQGTRTVLELFNDCDDIPDEKLNQLFDRFYRADESHNSQKSGYGIGLSIAKVLANRNKGEITAVKTKPNSVTFRITFQKGIKA